MVIPHIDLQALENWATSVYNAFLCMFTYFNKLSHPFSIFSVKYKGMRGGCDSFTIQYVVLYKDRTYLLRYLTSLIQINKQDVID